MVKIRMKLNKVDHCTHSYSKVSQRFYGQSGMADLGREFLFCDRSGMRFARLPYRRTSTFLDKRRLSLILFFSGLPWIAAPEQHPLHLVLTVEL